MAVRTSIPELQMQFKNFLLQDKRTLYLIAISIISQWIIFKYFYPFASFIHGDSFSYINSAYENFNISTYLIGYSKFLRLYSVFFRSDIALTTFQYLLIQGSTLYLLFTLFYFYKPGKVIERLLLVLIVFNPLFWHLGNLISSDGLFLAVSMIWFSILLWVIHRPSKRIIIIHAIILFIAFTIRYNALLYPLISALAFSLSKMALRQKALGLGLCIILCGSFIINTSYQYRQLTGYWQYSPFSGWQMANNAMYAYRYVSPKDRKPVPIRFKNLHSMISTYFDTTRDLRKHPTEGVLASTFYMWSAGMPLVQYQNKVFHNDSSISRFKQWATLGPLYKSYGTYIIRQYPWHFLRYFIWPNASKYYAPPVEFLESYNSGKNEVAENAIKWFRYKSQVVKSRMNDKDIWILEFYPILAGIVNIVILCATAFYLLIKGWKYDYKFSIGLLHGITFWIINAAFTIFASSAALRFQSFPIILTLVFAALLINWMVQFMRKTNPSTISTIESQPTVNETEELRITI